MGGTQLKKILEMVDLLSQPRGASIEEIREKLQVSRRTVYNLLDILEELGFAPYDEKELGERAKRWFLINPQALSLGDPSPENTMTSREYLSLHLMQGITAAYMGKECALCTQKALEKLGRLFFQTHRTQGDSLKKLHCLMLSSDTLKKTYDEKEEIIHGIIRALLKEEILKITYHSFSREEIISFPINPLQFFESQGGLYLFYESPLHHEVRVLAVDRILEIVPTGEHFIWPEYFDGQALLDDSFAMIWDDPVEITLWISTKQAKYVRERNITKQHRVEEEEDGSLKIYMTTSGWWTIKQWVLSMGAEAAVLAPESLRREMQETLRAIQDLYSQQKV